ncbi:hypothetical protein M405DRAFT_931194 [Rhizopogon salebrosus TDB-379]|nr:hypothetical protein M405DRAFT_931194 [Rhizopogon salebrosus TDB-379]
MTHQSDDHWSLMGHVSPLESNVSLLDIHLPTVSPPPVAFPTQPPSFPEHCSYLQRHQLRPLEDIEQSTSSIDNVSSVHAINDQGLINAYNRIINICRAEIVTIRQLQVAMEYNFQGISGDEYANNSSPQHLALQRIQCQLSEQECCPFLQESDRGVTSPPASQPSPDLPPGTSVYANYGVSPPLPSFAPQNDTCFEGQVFSDPSDICHQEPPPHVVWNSKEKMRCTWPGCSSVIQKGSYARHEKETHRRTVKGVCAHCSMPFRRLYLKRNHELTCRA